MKDLKLDKNTYKDIIENISEMALTPYNYLDFKSRKFLERCDIEQSELDILPYSEIIITEDVYNKIKNIENLSYNDRFSYREESVYLLGINIGYNKMFFTSYARNKGFNRDELLDNLYNEYERILSFENVSCFAHVHTHPYYEYLSKNIHVNQDLCTYAYIQSKINDDNKSIVGALIDPYNDGLSFVYYDINTKQFYKISNVYVMDSFGVLNPVNKKDKYLKLAK